MSTIYSSLNFGFDDTVSMLQEQARNFAQNEILPIADETDKSNNFPAPLWQKLGAMGLLGLSLIHI